MDGYKTELERDYRVSILDKDSICNMETKRWHHVGVNSPIYLFITSKDSFPYKENKKRPDLDFPCCFLSSLARFYYFKGRLWKAFKMEELNNSFPYVLEH
jgi:hypothetical protein